MEIPNTYHLFGDVWLEPPEKYLTDEELARLQTLEPLIEKFKCEQKGDVQYNLEKAFCDFTESEIKAWRSLGGERPRELLLYPSGDINASVACHLHNPTFYVKQPYSQETENPSNPTIQQINQAGFSSKNCFIYDHICRRDRTDDVLLFYTSYIRKIHEDFMLAVRKEMAAKVEICWGKPVRERMKQLLNLIPIKLWGRLSDVELFLEVEGSRMVRFVLFVAHPQYFFYHGHFTKKGLRFRETQARKQDLYLTVAGQLGSITTRQQNFYETIHRPALYGQFKKTDRELVNQMEAEADIQLKAAFPQKYQEIEASAKAHVEKAQVEITSDLSTLSEKVRGNIEKECLTRYHQLGHMVQSLLNAAGAVLVDGITLRSLTQLEPLWNATSDLDEISQWDEIPIPLIIWIQQQDGLKFDRKPISSKDELILAYHLLSPIEDNSHDRTLMQVVLMVATWYISRSHKRRQKKVLDLMIPGVKPHNIIPRKCSRCGQPVLDDAFACYAKADPKKYVLWYRMHGCGRPTCRPAGRGFANLVPIDPNQGYKMATRKSLLCLRSADWEEYLLRCSEDERREVQQVVQTRCRNCGVQTCQDSKPRWTCEEPPRYVIPVRGCRNCKRRFCPFVPSDTRIATISKVGLVKKWKDLKKGGIQPAEYPRRPDILWSRKSHLTKRIMLEEAREMTMASEEVDALSQEPKQRKFNTKRRINL